MSTCVQCYLKKITVWYLPSSVLSLFIDLYQDGDLRRQKKEPLSAPENEEFCHCLPIFVTVVSPVLIPSFAWLKFSLPKLLVRGSNFLLNLNEYWVLKVTILNKITLDLFRQFGQTFRYQLQRWYQSTRSLNIPKVLELYFSFKKPEWQHLLTWKFKILCKICEQTTFYPCIRPFVFRIWKGNEFA